MRTELMPGGRFRYYTKPGSANDLVANAARQATDQIISDIEQLPADQRAAMAQRVANTLRPDGAAWVAQQIMYRRRAGDHPTEALRKGMAALVANEFDTMARSGKLPAWWRNRSLSGLGALGSSWLDALMGAGTGVACAVGTDAMKNALNCNGGGSAAPVVVQAPEPTFPTWGYLAIGGGVLVLAIAVGGVVMMSSKKGRR